jgi:hypothetical protein
MDNNIDKDLTFQNILICEELFDTYCEYENICIQNINSIAGSKNKLEVLLDREDKDDIIFYKSLVNNSLFYLSKSLNVRKMKFKQDLNFIWQKIDEKKQYDEVNKINFMILLKQYKKMVEDVIITQDAIKKDNIKINWIKSDKREHLKDLENSLYKILTFHLKLIKYLCLYSELERKFYSE